MSQAPRFLITTADERTWKFDRPVIFLGEWCRRYDRRHIWEGMDAIVAEPFGISQAQEDEDTHTVRKVEGALLRKIVPVLNRLHHLDQSERYWRIIIGHWLRRFTVVLFNRYHTLRQCYETYHLSGCAQLDVPDYVLACADSSDFVHACNDAVWSDNLWGRVLALSRFGTIPIEKISIETKNAFERTHLPAPLSATSELRGWAERVSCILAGNHKNFIINSYLPRDAAIKLNLALGQLPQLWSTSRPRHDVGVDPSQRAQLSLEAEKGLETEFEKLAAKLVWELLPVSYLEGFSAVARIGETMGWPRRTNAIFTSNCYDSDDIFKVWAANRIAGGARYIIGQHGNNYGTRREMVSTVEEEVADLFVTWGWDGDSSRHRSGFVFKYPSAGVLQHDPDGCVLLVEYAAPYHTYLHDQFAKFEPFFAEQIQFATCLKRPARSELIVRLPSNINITHENEIERWSEFDANIKFDHQSSSMKTAIARSRLVVFSYDSTGMLETLSQNIPTLAFWQNGLDHLRDDAVPHYQLLVDAGIVHFSGESAAWKVNEVFEDVDEWWQSEKVQEARRDFCDRYARQVDDPIGLLKSTLVGEDNPE